MDEAREFGSVLSYGDIKKISQKDTERGRVAKEAIDKADAEADQIQANPEAAGQQYPLDPEQPDGDKVIKYARQATNGEEIPVGYIRDGKTVGGGDYRAVRSDLAALYFQQGIAGEVAGSGEPLSPETQELYSRDRISELLNLNVEPDEDLLWGGAGSNVGSQLIGVMGEMYKLAKELGIDSLFGTKTTSIPTKVHESLLGKKYQIATEAQALQGDLSKYERPDPQAVLGSLQNLKKVLELYKKSETTEKLTQDEYEFIKTHVNRVSFREGGRESFRVFIKSPGSTLGLSFDWQTRTSATELQTVINNLESNLERSGSAGDIDYTGLNYTDITDLYKKGGLGYVIGDVAEDAGLITSLFQMKTPEAVQKGSDLFESLYEKHGEKLKAAFNIAEGAGGGALIGTAETEALGIDIAQLKSTFGSTEAGGVLLKLVPTLLKAVATDFKKMKPDFVARVGTSRAGSGGDKTDQVLFYKTQKQANAAAKLAGTKPKKATLKDLLNKEELAKTVDAYGKAVNPNEEYHYIDDSLKCTNDPKVTNVGSGASPLGIARGFIGKDKKGDEKRDAWSDGLVDTLLDSLSKDKDGNPTNWEANNPDPTGAGRSMRDRVTENFQQIEKDIKELNSIFGTGADTVSPGDAQTNLLTSLTGGALSDLGLTSQDTEKLSKLMKKGMQGDSAIMSFKRNLEQSIIAKRIEQGSAAGDASWRTTGSLMMMKGCYDTADGSKFVVDYLTGNAHRGSGNDSVMKDLKHYITTGEGWASSSKGKLGEGSSFRIGGSKCTYTHSKKTGEIGTKYETVGFPSREDSSTEYSPTELMNKLLEVQQLIFSNLIKE